MDLKQRILQAEPIEIWHKYPKNGWEFKIRRISFLDLYWIDEQKEYFWLDGKLAEHSNQKAILEKKLDLIKDWKGVRAGDFILSVPLSMEEQQQEVHFDKELLKKLVADHTDIIGFLTNTLIAMALDHQAKEEEEKKS